MADLYSYTPIHFVNSITGTGTNGNIKTLVPTVWDALYHKKVQDKLFWRQKGLIGPDTFTEGSVTETATGYPVLSKTNLSAQAGDTIIMGQIQPLSVDPFNTGYVGGGQVGDTQLVGRERTWDFYHKKVVVEEQREGAIANAKGMDAQRNPYKTFSEQAGELLSDWQALTQDQELFFAFHFGQSPHYLRKVGYDANSDGYDLAATPAAAIKARSNPNLLVGNDTGLTTYSTTALAQTQMNTSDTDFATWRAANKISPKTFEIISAYARKNKWDLVSINGKKYIVCVISPQMELQLRTNDEFKEAAYYASERGSTNPIFQKTDYVFADCLIYVANAVNDTIGAYRADQLVATYNGADRTTGVKLTPTEYVDDAAASVSGKIGQVMFMGANAMALADGAFEGPIARNEDDYRKIMGRGVSAIYGCSRMDWLSETGPGTTVTNQSSGNIIVGI